MAERPVAEMAHHDVDTQQVLDDMFEQVNKELKDGPDSTSVDVAVVLDDKINQRIEDAVKRVWNAKLRNWVEQRVQEEVADLGLKLGKRVAELLGERGKL